MTLPDEMTDIGAIVRCQRVAQSGGVIVREMPSPRLLDSQVAMGPREGTSVGEVEDWWLVAVTTAGVDAEADSE